MQSALTHGTRNGIALQRQEAGPFSERFAGWNKGRDVGRSLHPLEVITTAQVLQAGVLGHHGVVQLLAVGL